MILSPAEAVPMIPSVDVHQQTSHTPSLCPLYSRTSWQPEEPVLKLETILLVEALYVVFIFWLNWLAVRQRRRIYTTRLSTAAWSKTENMH